MGKSTPKGPTPNRAPHTLPKSASARRQATPPTGAGSRVVNAKPVSSSKPKSQTTLHTNSPVRPAPVAPPTPKATTGIAVNSPGNSAAGPVAEAGLRPNPNNPGPSMSQGSGRDPVGFEVDPKHSRSAQQSPAPAPVPDMGSDARLSTSAGPIGAVPQPENPLPNSPRQSGPKGTS